jgi:hypothetical protein
MLLVSCDVGFSQLPVSITKREFGLSMLRRNLVRCVERRKQRVVWGRPWSMRGASVVSNSPRRVTPVVSGLDCLELCWRHQGRRSIGGGRGVAVGFTPDAFDDWEEGERAYAAVKALPNEQLAAATRTPDYRDTVHAMLGARIKAGVEPVIAERLNGSRPVRLDIVVRQFTIPSVGQRVLIGGDPQMFASATLVDARTGAVIVAHPDLEAFMPGGHGIIGVAVAAAMDNAMNQTQESKLIARYANAYRNWLTHEGGARIHPTFSDRSLAEGEAAG